MYLLTTTSLVLAIAIRGTVCDFLGLAYPAPTDLTSSNSLVRAAWEDVSAIFDAGIKQGKNTSATQDLLGTEKVTFSSGLFSIHDAAATNLQYHYTAPQIANSVKGTQEVDADSIYRVASVTKLITVLLGLLDLTDEDWYRPITDIVPELGEDLTPTSPEWDKITLWALASHQAGLTATGPFKDYLTTVYGDAIKKNTSITEAELEAGLPPVPNILAALGPCFDLTCTQEQFVAATRAITPVFAPSTLPEYSDVGLMVLGMAISKISGKPYDQMYQDAIFRPLGMTSSLANAPLGGPLLDRSVIVNKTLPGTWEFPYNNPTLPSGGIVSTVTDLQTLGNALLNSTLLSPEATQRWMKPHAHTASLSYSIGAPWEITRYVHKGSGKVTDIYAKLGDSGAYGGMLVVIPEYGAGFTLLNAYYETTTNIRSPAALVFINHIVEAIVPALEAQAAAEATSNYAGTYVSTDASFNSSIEIVFNEATIPNTGPSLSITSWISNDVDMIKEQYASLKPRLLLSIPKDSPGAGNVTFQATVYPQWNTYAAAGYGPYTGFYESNWDTYAGEGPRYAGGHLNQFTFDVDASGAAKAVSNGATRLRMEKS